MGQEKGLLLNYGEVMQKVIISLFLQDEFTDVLRGPQRSHNSPMVKIVQLWFSYGREGLVVNKNINEGNSTLWT